MQAADRGLAHTPSVDREKKGSFFYVRVPPLLSPPERARHALHVSSLLARFRGALDLFVVFTPHLNNL
jgi:hypothetical protein